MTTRETKPGKSAGLAEDGKTGLGRLADQMVEDLPLLYAMNNAGLAAASKRRERESRSEDEGQ